MPSASELRQLPADLAAVALTGDDLCASDEDLRPEWVVEGLIELDDTILLAGEEKKSFKSYLTLDWAIARVTGQPWLGFPVRQGQGRVLVITPESGGSLVRRRLRQLCEGRGLDVRDVAPRLAIVPESRITIVARDEMNSIHEATAAASVELSSRFIDPKKQQDVARAGKQAAERLAVNLGPGIRQLLALYQECDSGDFCGVVVDTVTNATAGKNQDDAAAMASYTAGLRDLARHLQCPGFSAHHTVKGSHGGEARNARGSVELTAGHKVLLSIETTAEGPTLHFGGNSHLWPEPIGYRLVQQLGGRDLASLTPDEKALLPVRFEVCAPAAKRSKADSKEAGGDEEILTILKQHAPTPVTVSNLPRLLATARGLGPGSKVKPGPVEASLERLGAARLAVKVRINGADFDGWRAGTDATPGTRERIDARGEAFGDPANV
jgi:hypothetical protein